MPTRFGIADRWFARIDAILSGKQAWISAITFVLVLQIALTTQHRPWLDEWQALQLAAQSPRLSDLIFGLHYEGHPPLWYLILRGLAALLPDPAYALPAAALIIAIPVQLTILLAAPFTRAERLMLALSEFMLFEYLTLSRSLTLGVAAMVAVAALWKRPRLVWLAIAILPMCDFLFGVISVLFVALRLRERRVYWPFAALWLASGLIAAWCVRPAPDIASALLPETPVIEFWQWLARMGTLGLPLQWGAVLPQWNKPPTLWLGAPALLAFFAMAWIELRKRRDFAAVFAAFVAVLLVFDLTVYQLSIRHLTLAAMLLIVLVWRMAEDGVDGDADGGADGGAPRSAWWRAWLIVIAACGLFTAAIALAIPFDTAPEAAATINRLGLREKTWVAAPRPSAQGIAAIGGMMTERLMQHCTEDFMRWNAPEDQQVDTFAKLDRLLRAKLQQNGRFYLISWNNIPADPTLLRRIAVIPPGYDGQAYYLYVVGETRPETRSTAPPCNGPHRPLGA